MHAAISLQGGLLPPPPCHLALDMPSSLRCRWACRARFFRRPSTVMHVSLHSGALEGKPLCSAGTLPGPLSAGGASACGNHPAQHM